ncbi:DUF3021 family protein [Levilactobacillus zymae]|uniref:DUF3021 family protein n=1 Tax=Levilactobacillus zymae TaxID=267363 RepID=UPI0028BC98F8|nr:DUF3021 family protein [Levilactobacillus zymae]MDT6979450.1 DUF3021 family protein [Levilactobacillus zymae]
MVEVATKLKQAFLTIHAPAETPEIAQLKTTLEQVTQPLWLVGYQEKRTTQLAVLTVTRFYTADKQVWAETPTGTYLIHWRLYELMARLPAPPSYVSRFTTPLLATVVSAGLWVLIGELWTWTSLFFTVERWSITRATGWHLVVSYLGMTTLAILCGWFPLNVLWLSFYTGIYTVVYLVVWSLEMGAARREIARLNQTLKQR